MSDTTPPPEFPFTPVPRARRKLTPARQRQFIAALARTGLVAEAAEEVGVSVAALEKLRYSPKGQNPKGGQSFRAAWDAARGCEAARKARSARRRDKNRMERQRLEQARLEQARLEQDPRDRDARGPDGADGDAGHVPHAFRLSPPAPSVHSSGAYCADPLSDHSGHLASRSARPSRRTSRAAFTGPEPHPDDPLLGFRPFLHRCPRRNSITPDRQRAFIAALAASGSVTQAARAIGASVEALYNLRARGGAEEFAAAWEKAIDLGIARLEDTALARAIEGELRPIVARGEIIGEYRVHNEGLVMFLLRNRRAARYGPPALRPAPEEMSEQDVIDSINEKLDRAREQMRRAEARKAGESLDEY
ncbi:hypothetical protein [Croceicoccus sp. Ery5]|uniref:hypothetical protein n=1 Tax=Croceicoccus sp. Ery5 TaxID=1703340 RepID=UPI001E3393C1|nr:hypothetical protein [Croceicoccus sp. Ery5]